MTHMSYSQVAGFRHVTHRLAFTRGRTAHWQNITEGTIHNTSVKQKDKAEGISHSKVAGCRHVKHWLAFTRGRAAAAGSQNDKVAGPSHSNYLVK
jgi:hypothetical protein